MRTIVALRHIDRGADEKDVRAAARRMSKLQASVEKLRVGLKRDLRSSDPERFLTALAVALLDETGVDPIAAKKKHVRFSEDEDTTSVMFKVNRHAKGTVANPIVVKALRNAFEAIDDEDDDLFRHPTGMVSSEAVTTYLGKYGLTSEKLRGFSASSRLQTKLTKIRARGGVLPKHGMAKKKMLRAEFERALTETATELALDPASIRAKYLAPGLEAAFLKDGTFVEKRANSAAFNVWLRFAVSL